MPISNVSWIWLGNRALLDPTPNTSITVPQREAVVGYTAEGGGQLKALTVSGSYAQPAAGDPNGFATWWWAQSGSGRVPTQFSYTLNDTAVSNVYANSAFAVTMRIQTAAQPDVFQDQAATLVQMSNGDMFFRPSANALGGWDSITRVHSIEVLAVNPSVTASYGAFNHTLSFKPEIFEVDFSVCYVRGTRILTDGGHVAVEALREGDIVVSRFGGLRPVRWIGKQDFAGDCAAGQEAIRFAPGSIADGIPQRALLVSPGHSMLVGDILVLATDLVNGITITREAPREEWSYVQIDLGTHDLLLAEGAWSESFADCADFRTRFDNYAEFSARFPHHRAPEEPVLCAQRPSGGAIFHAALRHTAERALHGQHPATLGNLDGRIEEVAVPCRVAGWVRDEDHVGRPVMLEIVLDDVVIGGTCACARRREAPDQGRMGFVFEGDRPLSAEELRRLIVRRTQDGRAIAAFPDVTAGPLQGHLDRVTSTGRLEGWARDKMRPGHPLMLEVVLEEEVLGAVSACRWRHDLEKAGLGDVAFVFQANRILSSEEIRAIQLRRSNDCALLRRSDETRTI